MTLILLMTAALIGFAAGLLANYLAEILPFEDFPGKPVCTACGEDLNWTIFFVYRFCHFCATRRPISALLSELSMAAISGAFAWLFGFSITWLALTLLAAYAIFIIAVDVRHRLILLESHLPGALICFLTGASLWGVRPALLGGAVGLGLMLFVYGALYLYNAILRKEKITPDDDRFPVGFGDVLLTGVLSLSVGAAGVLPLLFLSSLAGAAITVVINIYRWAASKPLVRTVPYGPYLVCGAFSYILLSIFSTALR